MCGPYASSSSLEEVEPVNASAVERLASRALVARILLCDASSDAEGLLPACDADSDAVGLFGHRVG